MRELGAVLRELREDLKLTQVQWAKRLGMAAPTVSQRENGRLAVPSSEIEKMVRESGRILAVAPDGWRLLDRHTFFRQGLGRADPVTGATRGELDRFAYDILGRSRVEPAPTAHEVFDLDWLAKADRVVEVVEDGMKPDFRIGDLVTVLRYPKESRPEPGQLVVVMRRGDGRALVRRWVGLYGRSRAVLAANDSTVPPLIDRLVDFTILGRAVGIVREYQETARPQGGAPAHGPAPRKRGRAEQATLGLDELDDGALLD